MEIGPVLLIAQGGCQPVTGADRIQQRVSLPLACPVPAAAQFSSLETKFRRGSFTK